MSTSASLSIQDGSDPRLLYAHFDAGRRSIINSIDAAASLFTSADEINYAIGRASYVSSLIVYATSPGRWQIETRGSLPEADEELVLDIWEKTYGQATVVKWRLEKPGPYLLSDPKRIKTWTFRKTRETMRFVRVKR